MKSTYEIMGGNYQQNGDYLLPKFEVPECPKVGVWGEHRRKYLREHQKAFYTAILLSRIDVLDCGHLSCYTCFIKKRQGAFVMEPITSFKRKETKFLSNFYPVTVTFEGDRYAAVEDAFQAAKTLEPKERMLIQLCETPADARKCGRRVTLRSDWNEIKVGVMLDLLRQKFSHPKLKAMLLATEDAVLVEGNTHHDNFWGDCTCRKCVEIEGQNHLGKLLMQVREELRNG